MHVMSLLGESVGADVRAWTLQYFTTGAEGDKEDVIAGAVKGWDQFTRSVGAAHPALVHPRAIISWSLVR
jgi:hypothetical protein